jgi:hypothetical protein
MNICIVKLQKEPYFDRCVCVFKGQTVFFKENLFYAKKY